MVKGHKCSLYLFLLTLSLTFFFFLHSYFLDIFHSFPLFFIFSSTILHIPVYILFLNILELLLMKCGFYSICYSTGLILFWRLQLLGEALVLNYRCPLKSHIEFLKYLVPDKNINKGFVNMDATLSGCWCECFQQTFWKPLWARHWVGGSVSIVAFWLRTIVWDNVVCKLCKSLYLCLPWAFFLVFFYFKLAVPLLRSSASVLRYSWLERILLHPHFVLHLISLSFVLPPSLGMS